MRPSYDPATTREHHAILAASADHVAALEKHGIRFDT